MSTIYEIGEQVEIAYTFVNSAGAAADPTVVTVSIKAPSGTETDYVYGTDAECVKDSTGAYHVDLTFAAAGVYHWRWVGTGAVVDAEEGFLRVRASAFTTP